MCSDVCCDVCSVCGCVICGCDVFHAVCVINQTPFLFFAFVDDASTLRLALSYEVVKRGFTIVNVDLDTVCPCV